MPEMSRDERLAADGRGWKLGCDIEGHGQESLLGCEDTRHAVGAALLARVKQSYGMQSVGGTAMLLRCLMGSDTMKASLRVESRLLANRQRGI